MHAPALTLGIIPAFVLLPSALSTEACTLIVNDALRLQVPGTVHRDVLHPCQSQTVKQCHFNFVLPSVPLIPSVASNLLYRLVIVSSFRLNLSKVLSSLLEWFLPNPSSFRLCSGYSTLLFAGTASMISIFFVGSCEVFPFG